MADPLGYARPPRKQPGWSAVGIATLVAGGLFVLWVAVLLRELFFPD